MGRPLNKKYFGNRNTNTAATGDDGLGGKQVASVTLGDLGAYTTRPTVTFSAPDLAGPGGVTATGTVTSEVVTAAVSNGLTGEGYTVGDLVTFTGITGVIGYVATVGSGVGEIQSITFTEAGTSRGTFTTLPADLTDVAVVGGTGTLATVNISFRAKAVVITNAGSGYTDATDAAATFTQSVTGTTVLTTTNEKAIVVTAFIPAANGGSSAVRGDIVKQTNDRRYKVKTAQGTGICQLVTDGVANAAGEVSIKATDSAGGNYLVAKLTARKVVLVPAALGGSAGTQFASGKSAKWTFGDAVLNTTVKIENA
jgi:hypothetical protein